MCGQGGSGLASAVEGLGDELAFSPGQPESLAYVGLSSGAVQFLLRGICLPAALEVLLWGCGCSGRLAGKAHHSGGSDTSNPPF